MGDPKFSRKKYERPSHPWDGERIKKENETLKTYGLKNKKEIWRVQSLLRNIRGQARDLNSRLRSKDILAEKESKALIGKLYKWGLLESTSATMDDVLSLSLEDLLKRRLQTIVFSKGLANSQKQARQFITHMHITVNDRIINIPSYIVKKEEEDKIDFSISSPLYSQDHPARVKKETMTTKKEQKVVTNG